MSSRASMMAGIRTNLAKSAPFERLYHHLQPSSHVSSSARSQLSQEKLADRFATELTAVGGEVHRVGSDGEAHETIGGVLREVGARRAAVSNLFADAELADVELITDPSRDDLFSVDAGISTAQLAIAETGTLVLRSAAERHRLVSLVPPIHICLLKASDIRAMMSDVLEDMSGDIDPAITFLTGPSRTSDIELTLAIGVHGPKRLIVVLIDGK